MGLEDEDDDEVREPELEGVSEDISVKWRIVQLHFLTRFQL